MHHNILVRRSGGKTFCTFGGSESSLTANGIAESNAAFIFSDSDVIEQSSRACAVERGVDESHRSEGLLQAMGVQQRDHRREDGGGGRGAVPLVQISSYHNIVFHSDERHIRIRSA